MAQDGRLLTDEQVEFVKQHAAQSATGVYRRARMPHRAHMPRREVVRYEADGFVARNPVWQR